MKDKQVLDQDNFLHAFLASCFPHKLSSSKLGINSSGYSRYVVSCSGGLDSIVLLHLMFVLKQTSLLKDIELSAVYVNHNLSPNAQMWAEFCQSVCSQYQIPLQCLSVNATPQPRQSPEAVARDARYGAIKKILTTRDCLLTAHHKNDQIETLFLNLLRGSGPKGLSSMAVRRKLFHFTLARPLLSFSQEEIKSYAKKNQLDWVEDESNNDLAFKRNFLRHQLLPEIKKQWQGYATSLYRVSELQKESIEILEEVAVQDLSRCMLEFSVQEESIWAYIYSHFNLYALNLDNLKKLSSARIKNCLQYWFRKNNIAVLNANLLKQFLSTFILASPSSTAMLCWKANKQDYRLHYHDKKLYLYVLETKHVFNIKVSDKKTITYKVAYRQGGEKFKKNKLSKHFLLKKWFQENLVPPWLRDKIPLFYVKDELTQVGNIVLNKDYKLIRIDVDE